LEREDASWPAPILRPTGSGGLVSRVENQGEERQKILERGEMRALARREVLDPSSEAAPPARTAVSAEVHDERPLSRKRRSVLVM